MITETATRNGAVYILRRPDLNLCYVGQSLNPTTRLSKHMREWVGNYVYNELHVGGVAPITEVVEEMIPHGVKLDETERDWMRAMSEEGWTLINRLGPDDAFPRMPFELLSKGGKKGGVIGGSNTAARRAADPEFDAHWREVAAKAGNAALRAKREANPEFDAKCREAELRGRTLGAKVRADRRASDTVWAETERAKNSAAGKIGGPKAGAKTNLIQRVCKDCGMGPLNPPSMGFHLRHSGHSGYTQVSSPNTEKKE